jgi:hypothetical protein
MSLAKAAKARKYLKGYRRCRSVTRWEVGSDFISDRSARCVLRSGHQTDHAGNDLDTFKRFTWKRGNRNAADY